MTAMSTSQRQDGWWYPWVFVGGFVVIITVNGIMAYIAVDSWTGLETDNAFERGQAFNTELAQKASQDALGWTVTSTFEHTPSTDNARAGILHLTFVDANSQGVSGLAIEAVAKRPTHEGFDQEITFAAQENGAYSAPAALPLAGQWELRVVASRGDEVFQLRQRIQVP